MGFATVGFKALDQGGNTGMHGPIGQDFVSSIPGLAHQMTVHAKELGVSKNNRVRIPSAPAAAGRPSRTEEEALAWNKGGQGEAWTLGQMGGRSAFRPAVRRLSAGSDRIGAARGRTSEPGAD